MATRGQHEEKNDESKMEISSPGQQQQSQQQQQQQGLKRKREDNPNNNNNDDDSWRPPKRVSPFLNTPKQRRDEKRKILRTSINKLREIENAEVCLHRAVLLHNTVRKLQKQLQEEKHAMMPRQNVNSPYNGRTYLSANAHLFVDHFVYADMEQIVDNSDLLDRMIGSLQTDAEIKMTKPADNNLSSVAKPVNLSGKDGSVYVDENCNQNQYTQVSSSSGGGGQYMLGGSCGLRSGSSTTNNDLACDFIAASQQQHSHHLYPQPSHTPPPPNPNPPISVSCTHGTEVDSTVLDMSIKEDKGIVDDLVSSSSKHNASDSVLSNSPPLTLSGSIARLSGSISGAINLVEGVRSGEDLVPTVITSSCSPPSSPPSPSGCLAGHTGYFSVISPDNSSSVSSSYSSSPTMSHYQYTSNNPATTSQHYTTSSSSYASLSYSSASSQTLPEQQQQQPSSTSSLYNNNNNTILTSAPAAPSTMPPPAPPSTCSEAYQRERSSPASLSPFLALLDDPWVDGTGSGMSHIGGGTTGPDKNPGPGTLADIDSVLGSIIGVLTGTC